MSRFDGKVALITGAASGIGQASALRFAADGASVMCADINIEGARNTAALIAEHGGAAEAMELDVSNPTAVKEALDAAVTRMGRLDALFNNAGISGVTLESDGTLKSIGWDPVISINLTGVYNGLFYGCELMAERGGGAIVSTASIAGMIGLVSPLLEDAPAPEYGSGAYAASKGAVVQMTRQFAVTYARRGVRVNAVAPGYIATPMTAFVQENADYQAFISALHPLERLGRPEEIAAAAAFLASDDASFITGVTLPVDGGYTAR
jgi:NAD(P)-dependent dehydrogenase (short-subunit alcohol dehydrogenase family)